MPTRTISTTAEELFPENLHRKSFIIQNEDSAIHCFIKRERDGTTASSTDHDHRVTAGDAFFLNSLSDGTDDIQARYTIVAASGTPRISIKETEDIRR